MWHWRCQLVSFIGHGVHESNSYVYLRNERAASNKSNLLHFLSVHLSIHSTTTSSQRREKFSADLNKYWNFVSGIFYGQQRRGRNTWINFFVTQSDIHTSSRVIHCSVSWTSHAFQANKKTARNVCLSRSFHVALWIMFGKNSSIWTGGMFWKLHIVAEGRMEKNTVSNAALRIYIHYLVLSCNRFFRYASTGLYEGTSAWMTINPLLGMKVELILIQSKWYHHTV